MHLHSKLSINSVGGKKCEKRNMTKICFKSEISQVWKFGFGSKLTWDVICLKVVMSVQDDGYQSLHTFPWVEGYQFIQ